MSRFAVFTIAALFALSSACSSGSSCAMFHAIFDVGRVTDGQFSSDVAYFQ